MSAPAVTVVVMTRDRVGELRESLPHHEHPVILLDNGSSDGSVEMVRSAFPDIRVVELGTNRGAVARNLGVALATTPYVAFADDDSWWAVGALDCAVRLFEEHPRLGVLAGRILVGREEHVDPMSVEMASSPLGQAPDLPGPSILGFLACGAVVRRTAFLAEGGFDDVVFFFGEEERLALDLTAGGWGLAYVDAVVAHHHPSPVRDTRRRSVRAARNRILTAVMRRPWSVVAATVAGAACEGPAGRSGALAAMRLIPRALVRRRPLPAEVEASRRLLG